MRITIAPRSWTSVVFRSFLIVPVILLFIVTIYDIVLRWNLSISTHRHSYKAIASKYLQDEPAKFEDDTWVEMIGHSPFFVSTFASLFSASHLFILITEALIGKSFAEPLPKIWYEMIFGTLGFTLPPYIIATYWTFLRDWPLGNGMRCTLNHNMRKMRCSPITTYCVMPELYPDLLPREDLVRDCERATKYSWLVVINLVSTLAIIVPLIYIERSRVLKYRAISQLLKKAKALEAQEDDIKEEATVRAAVLGDLSDKEPQTKSKMTKKMKALYFANAFYGLFSLINFVRRLFE